MGKTRDLFKKSTGTKEDFNAKFQRIARRDKKSIFLSEQCKVIEKNSKMGKTRDLFKKIKYQENISCKDGHNKGQKWYGPNRSRRDQEEMQRTHRTVQKKILMTHITTMVQTFTQSQIIWSVKSSQP